jgi:hypothetical protein
MEDPLPSWPEYLAAYLKGDSACVLAASRLPGCTARRFDFPVGAARYRTVRLCFASGGPIVPSIGLNYTRYLSAAGARFFYTCMLQDQAGLTGGFSGEALRGSVELKSGPGGMATKLLEMVQSIDLIKLIAAGSVERIFADPPPSRDSWTSLRLALCGVYLKEFERADALLRDCLTEVTQDDRPNFAEGIAKTKLYRRKLNADPEALRQELIATMNNNWSHFKIVTNE